MNRFWSTKTIIERCEFVAAILLTLLLLGVHIIFYIHAGPLWRDEVSSLTLATKPTLSQFWKSLPLDPFPASYFLLLRGWSAIGFANHDVTLRGLGLLIGLSILAALWLTCYLIDKSPPLWPLALFAFNPLVLEGGDSLRPYGFGLIWIVLAFGFIWRIAAGEMWKRILIFAFIAALLSVQSLFTNALMLFAVGVSAAVVLIKANRWRDIWVIISIGAVAASSLLVYLPIIQSTRDWAKIIGNKNDIVGVLAVARDAILDAGTVGMWAWLALGAGLLLLLLLAFCRRLAVIADLKSDRATFGGATVLVCIVATVTFLCAAHYLVFPRYFLPVMAIIALSIHIFWSALPNRFLIRTIGLCLALLVCAASLKSLCQRANTRMTNCDQIAEIVEQRAVPDDLIIVTSFFYGISFQRYYHGDAPWLAVPQVSDFTLHRWDLLREAMAQPDPVPELVLRAEAVLRAGHKVFLVGKLGPSPPERPESFPPAPQTDFGWQMESYLAQWKSELTYWIEHHAVNGRDLSIQDAQPVNPLEGLGLFEVCGWRGD